MVDPDDKVVIINVDGINQVLFKATDGDWHLDTSMSDFNTLISQLGSIEVIGEQVSENVTFTVDEVDYSFNVPTGVITPALEIE